MDRRELQEAIASMKRTSPSSGLLPHLRAAAASTVALLLRPGVFRRPRSLAVPLTLGGLASIVRTPGPLRAAILSIAALAAGVLGLVVAYAVVPQEGVAAQVNGSTVRLVTVTGPEGTTTLAITKTKEGKTKIVPVRLLRTVTGPGGVSTLSIAVTGPAVTDTDVITQIHQQTQTEIVQNTLTEVVTQPVTVVVTDVVTQPETVVDTETVFVEVTTTVTAPPGP
jgi:hypothetical protein